MPPNLLQCWKHCSPSFQHNCLSNDPPQEFSFSPVELPHPRLHFLSKADYYPVNVDAQDKGLVLFPWLKTALPGLPGIRAPNETGWWLCWNCMWVQLLSVLRSLLHSFLLRTFLKKSSAGKSPSQNLSGNLTYDIFYINNFSIIKCNYPVSLSLFASGSQVRAHSILSLGFLHWMQPR